MKDDATNNTDPPKAAPSSRLNIACFLASSLTVSGLGISTNDLFYPLVGGVLFLIIGSIAAVVLTFGKWSSKVKQAGASILLGSGLAFIFLWFYLSADVYWLGKYDLLR